MRRGVAEAPDPVGRSVSRIALPGDSNRRRIERRAPECTGRFVVPASTQISAGLRSASAQASGSAMISDFRRAIDASSDFSSRRSRSSLACCSGVASWSEGGVLRRIEAP
jgi:hypothetical protein